MYIPHQINASLKYIPTHLFIYPTQSCTYPTQTLYTPPSYEYIPPIHIHTPASHVHTSPNQCLHLSQLLYHWCNLVDQMEAVDHHSLTWFYNGWGPRNLNFLIKTLTKPLTFFEFITLLTTKFMNNPCSNLHSRITLKLLCTLSKLLLSPTPKVCSWSCVLFDVFVTCGQGPSFLGYFYVTSA